MAKDWEQYKNVVNPVWNNGYQRYDLSMDEVIQKIKDMGYILDKEDEDIIRVWGQYTIPESKYNAKISVRLVYEYTEHGITRYAYSPISTFTYNEILNNPQ